MTSPEDRDEKTPTGPASGELAAAVAEPPADGEEFDEVTDADWERGEVPHKSVSTSVAAPVAGGLTAVTPAVRAAAGWSWRFIVIVGASAMAFWLITQVKTVAIPVLVAALIAALLLPLKNFCRDRLRFPPALASFVTLLVAVGAISGLVAIVGATASDDLRQLSEKAVEGFNEVVKWLGTGPLDLGENAIQDYLDELQNQITANMKTLLSGAWSLTSSVGHIFAGSLIAMFCLFFFLKDGRLIWEWVVGLFPRASRERVFGAGERAWHSLGAYTRTQIMVAFVDGLGIGLGALLLGVPLAIPIGVIVFIGSFIPILGATITGAVAIAVALVDQGFTTAVLMFLVVLVVQQLESNLLQPMLMSKALSLHPVGVLLAVAAGTIVAGIVGALFAVPLVAVANSVLKYLNSDEPTPMPGPDGLPKFRPDAISRFRW